MFLYTGFVGGSLEARFKGKDSQPNRLNCMIDLVFRDCMVIHVKNLLFSAVLTCALFHVNPFNYICKQLNIIGVKYIHSRYQQECNDVPFIQ